MIVHELSVELGSDEGAFLIQGVRPSETTVPALPDNTLASWWSDVDADFESFMVATGSQWGPFGVLVRILDDHPGPAEDRWQDVVETSVNAGESIAISEVVDGPLGEVMCDAGAYRMRIAALGRTESATRDYDSDDSDTPLEHYLIELWPTESAPPEIVREESQHAKDMKSPPTHEPPDAEAPGLEAARAIIRDLRGEPGARTLPGDLGTLTVTLQLPGTTSKIFKRLRDVFGWPPCQGGSGSPDPDAPVLFDATVPDTTGTYETVGAIETTLLEVDEPNRIVKHWNWLLHRGGTIDTWPRLLAVDSEVAMTVQQVNESDGEPRVLVRLTHEGIPTVWIHDLERLWTWHLVVQAAR